MFAVEQMSIIMHYAFVFFSCSDVLQSEGLTGAALKSCRGI